jgi:hypothetical protein
VYKLCGGTGFLCSEGLCFARNYHHTFGILLVKYQCILIYHPITPSVMDITKSGVIKSLGNERMQVTNADQVGRQQKTTTVCDCESNEVFVR